jgi:hypothetical protein
MPIQVTASHDGLRLRVNINGRLHIHILDTTELMGVMSWHVARKYFAIELTLAGNAKITAEYDDEQTWFNVLDCLDKVLEARGAT